MDPQQTLLLVDDAQANLAFLSTILKKEYSIRVAKDGQKALALVASEQIDLILLDIEMPGMNGYEVCQKLKNSKATEHIPVIFVTGNTDSKDEEKGFELGAVDYITKPFRPTTIKTRVKTHINLRLRQVELEKSQNFLQKYQEVVDEGSIVSKTNIKGIITYVNSQFCKISGHKEEELLGKTHNVVRHPDMPKETFADLWHTIKTLKQTWHGKIKNRKKGGDYYWAETTIKPILDTDGKIVEFIALRTDITKLEDYQETLKSELNSAIEDIRQKDEMLLKQAKSAAMGEMIDAIAHQWKSPLGLVSLHSTFLLEMHEGEEFVPFEDVKKCKEAVTSQIDHLVETIDTFRSFFRPNPSIGFFSAKKIVHECITLMKDELTQHTVSVNFIGKDAQIFVVKNEFKHILINLFSNSKDAFVLNNITPREIKVSVETLSAAETKIYIQDNAGGIPQTTMENIFNPHFTTKEATGGTGIGLYLCRQILDKEGSSIIVYNKEDGACFEITLFRAHEAKRVK